MQHGDGVLQLHIRAPDQPSGVQEIAFRDEFQSPFQFKGGALHKELRSLVNHLEGHLIFMEQLRRLFLQGKEFVGAQIALVIGSSLSGQDGFPHFVSFVHAMCEALRSGSFREIVPSARVFGAVTIKIQLTSLHCKPQLVGWLAFGSPNTAVTDADLLVNQASWYHDETNTNLVARIKYYAGGLRNARIPVDINLITIYASGATTTCANTNITKPRIIQGTVALTAGAATSTGISPAFASTSSACCGCDDNTIIANRCSATLASTSSISVNGTGTDTVAYVCAGS
jgi:hypothetical protein